MENKRYSYTNMARIAFTLLLLCSMVILLVPQETKAMTICMPLTPLISSVAADEQRKLDCEKTQEANRIFSGRVEALAPYEKFFVEAGVKLTLTTTADQYNSWKSKVVKAKKNYDVQQKKIAEQNEADEKLKEQKKIDQELKLNELEKRVRELETQKPPTNIPLVHKAEIQTSVAIPVTPKSVQIKIPQTRTIEESTSSVKQDVPLIPPKKMSWWQHLFSWFK